MIDVVYHWTSIKNSKQILKNGLRKYSFVCREPDDWRGKVCLRINLDVDWDHREEHASWQAITHKKVQPHDISLMEG